MFKCTQCNYDIYIQNKIDGCIPGSIYKNKKYCIKCLDSIYFLEDIMGNSDDDQSNISIKKDKPKIIPKNTIECPFCKNIMKVNQSICLKCNKTHPLFIRKSKVKSKRKKKKFIF